MKKTYPFFKRTLQGLAIGISAVTPGLSSGVIAAAIGLYEPAIHAFASLRKEFRKSFLFLLPLLIGGCAGLFLFSNLMEQLVALARFEVLYLFLGLVIGTIPSLIGEANAGGGFRKRYLFATAAACAAVIALKPVLAVAPLQAGTQLTPLLTVVCGAVFAVGAIIPGISGSFLLIYMGVYESLLSAVAHFNLPTLALLAAGFVAAAIPLIKLVDFLFRRFRGWSYYAVLGFLIGSVFMVFPGFQTGSMLAADLLLLAGGAAASFALMRWGAKHKSG